MIEDGEQDSVELIDVLADDKAIDLDAWLDAKVWLLGCPKRLVEIAHKKASGIPLAHRDMIYPTGAAKIVALVPTHAEMPRAQGDRRANCLKAL